MEIELTQGKVALIDDEDWPRVSKLKWCVAISSRTTYAVSRTRKQTNQKEKHYKQSLSLHRFIMNLPIGDKRQVDHINHNTLDCRKQNLRICAARQNSYNHKLSKTNTSGFKGVYFNKKYKKWEARIRLPDKKAYLGRYNSPLDAAHAYDSAAELYYGEFAMTNKKLGLFSPHN
jgi:hypothetical protein